MEDGKLLRRMQKGDAGSLEVLIRRYTPYVSAVVYRFLGSLPREDLEEAVADTFVALWRHAADLEAETLRSWLGTVAANKAKSKLRAHTDSAPLLETLPSPEKTPEGQTESQETGQALWRAVDSLPEPERTLFFRYYYEGEKLKTVAAELGLSLSAAKTKLFRGRQVLKEILLRENGGESLV